MYDALYEYVRQQVERASSNRDFSICQNPNNEEVVTCHRFMQRGMVVLFASLCFLLSGVAALAKTFRAIIRRFSNRWAARVTSKAGFLKVNIPRQRFENDDFRASPRPRRSVSEVGVALTKASDGSDVMIGRTWCLLAGGGKSDSLRPARQRIDVTALHNHFFWDDPHVYFMHVHGMGQSGRPGAPA